MFEELTISSHHYDLRVVSQTAFNYVLVFLRQQLKESLMLERVQRYLVTLFGKGEQTALAFGDVLLRTLALLPVIRED